VVASTREGSMGIDVPGGRLAWDVVGEGPLVVCLPGIGDLRDRYAVFAARLSADFRVVSVDLRGQGSSDVGFSEYTPEAVGADLARVLEFFGEPAIVVSNSMTAASSVWAAAEKPALVAGLVLTGPFVREVELSWPMKAAFWAMFAGPWAGWAWATWQRTLAPTLPKDELDRRYAAIRASLAEPGRLDAVRGFLSSPKTACEQRIPEVCCPVRVVMGSKDPDFSSPAEEARAVADLLHGQVLLVDAGHYPAAEQPDEVAAYVAAFAREVGHASSRA
jgi:pimeloyl-ACP methyl ester carboxylesterase